MEAHDITTILRKNFTSLSREEKEAFVDLFTNEEEFLLLQQTMNNIYDLSNQMLDEPNPAIKKDLDVLFHQTYRSKGVLWYNQLGMFFIHPDRNWYQQNATRIAAILLIGLFVFPFINQTKLETKKQQVAKIANTHVNENTDKDASPKSEQLPEKTTPNLQVASNLSEPEMLDELDEYRFVESADDKSLEVVASATQDMDGVAAAPAMISNHPDGVFMGVASVQDASFELFRHVDVLDVLTATY